MRSEGGVERSLLAQAELGRLPAAKMTLALTLESVTMTQAHRNHTASVRFEEWRVKHPKFIFNMTGICENDLCIPL